MWIKKLPDGTLEVPLVANSDDTIGDGLIIVKKTDPNYQKYLAIYQDEQERIAKFKINSQGD